MPATTAKLTVMTTAIADTGNRAGEGRRAGLPARLCATVALASVGAHVWMGWQHRAMPWEAALMLLMAAVCLPCAVDVWRGAHRRAVTILFAMALAMVAVHGALLVGSGSMGAHQHGAMSAMGAMGSMGDAGAQGAAANPLAASMLGIIALELGVAMAAAWVMRRTRACAAP